MKKNKKKIKKKRKLIRHIAKKKSNKKKKNKKKYIKKKNKKREKKLNIKINLRSKGIILNIVRLQEKIKSKFSFKLGFDFFSIDRSIQSFFQKIDNKLEEYKVLKAEEKKRIRIEKIEKEKREKEEIEKNKIQEEKNRFKLKQQQLKDEERLERERAKDIKLFLRKEQAILRKEQSERQKRFLQELRLEQQIEKFRIREVKELEKLEKISLKEQREDYAGLQERIEKLKEKYRLIRDQKIKERVEALGVKIQEGDDRETLLEKERKYYLARQKIELALESFYRSANSLVFQLNKRHLTRQMSIFRCIDRRFETGEIFIKWDDSSDDEWLILIYIKDNSPDEGMIIEDKSNPEKNLSHEFKPSEIFKASDLMVDSLTQLVSRERSREKNN
tara:strand:+ start:1995 stop:3161 length:1167 start_codon:yes stop_codon:yes gene_type:complete